MEVIEEIANKLAPTPVTPLFTELPTKRVLGNSGHRKSRGF